MSEYVVVRRRDVHKHKHLAVAAERVLQQESQFGIAIGNVRIAAVPQCVDDVTEGR